MFIRMIFCLSVLVLTSCSTARMAIYPGLENNSIKYKITSMPNFFSGGDLVFGPYSATKISRSGINTHSSYQRLGGIKFGGEKKGQYYDYQFNGKNHWKSTCTVRKGHSSIGIVSGQSYMNLGCTFVPINSKNTTAREWDFNFEGPWASKATATIKVGSKTIRVIAINKMKGSSLILGQNTGYYFYSGKKIIAGVDAISKEGPVWLNNKLSQHEKDIIGMVVVALLLNQNN